jgi:hypothetical protein
LLTGSEKRSVIMITSGERTVMGPSRTAPLAAEPVTGLLRQLLRELSTLCRQEVALAKTDFSSSLAAVGKSIAVVAIAGAVIFGGFLALLSAAILALGAVMSMWLAALTTGVAVVILGSVLLKIGQSKLGGHDMTSARSRKSLRRDKEVLARAGS